MQKRRFVTPLNDAYAMARQKKFFFGLCLVTVFIIVIDQVSTVWALDALRHRDLHVIGPITLQLSYNTGVAFSLGQSLGGLIILIVIVILLLGFYILKYATKGLPLIAGGLVLGGALGNLGDRLFRSDGAVVDFIKVGFWPIFNLADASIVIGAILLAISYLKDYKRPEPDRQKSAVTQEGKTSGD